MAPITAEDSGRFHRTAPRGAVAATRASFAKSLPRRLRTLLTGLVPIVGMLVYGWSASQSLLFLLVGRLDGDRSSTSSSSSLRYAGGQAIRRHALRRLARVGHRASFCIMARNKACVPTCTPSISPRWASSSICCSAASAQSLILAALSQRHNLSGLRELSSVTRTRALRPRRRSWATS